MLQTKQHKKHDQFINCRLQVERNKKIFFFLCFVYYSTEICMKEYSENERKETTTNKNKVE